jgi:hypothetical protein
MSKQTGRLEQGMIVRIERTECSDLSHARDGRGRSRFRAGAGAILAGFLAGFALIWCTFAHAAEPRVLLLRGWFGVFSTGMDSLADELRARGINAKVAGHLHWSTAMADILREASAGNTGPLILVGHSQGGNNVIDIARALEPHHVAVDLLVTLAPFMQDPVPGNVLRAINYYQSPGWGAPLTPGRGFRGRLSNIDVANDLTITHVTIDKSARVRAEIVREIAALARAEEREGPGKLPAATAPPSSDAKRRARASAGIP